MPPKKSAEGATTTANSSQAKRQPVSLRKTQRIISVEYVESLKAYAEILFRGELCPAGVSRPEALAARIEVGRDVGLPDTQAIAYVMIVNGRPAIWGDAAMALVRASGLLEDIEEETEGRPGDDDFTAICRVKRVGAQRDRVCKFSIGDAKRAGLWGKKGPWAQYPERQMMWRARGFAVRDEFQDVLCGLTFAEEALDVEPMAASPPVRIAVVESPGVVTMSNTKAIEALPLGQPPEAEPSPNPVETSLASSNGLITDEQIVRIISLRSLVMAAHSVHDADGQKELWKKTLQEMAGIETVKGITEQKAAETIAALEAKYDFPPVGGKG